MKMMQKIKPVAFLILMFTCHSLCAGLIEFYKKGTIKLVPSPEFGKDTDWESLFYDTAREFVVAQDGSIFVINNSRHNGFKFTGAGRYVGMFGQKGEGPGDLYR
ncbi:MAG: hypothetical protein GY940_39660, partial [bacterium]|nr:hypothetical protein [bacterium]